MFSEGLIQYTESRFAEQQIGIHKNTKVKKITNNQIETEVLQPDGSTKSELVPYGLLVWAAGNAVRPVVRDFMNQLPEQASSRRGLLVDDYLRVQGTENVWAIGDCTATKYSPTGQVAHQEGAYLAESLNMKASIEEDLAKTQALPPFEYTHQGTLAYVGNNHAIADLSMFGKGIASAGPLTHVLWRAAYIKMCISGM
jgi:NADH:ubiquinone reductase (non-electrogenic)